MKLVPFVSPSTSLNPPALASLDATVNLLSTKDGYLIEFSLTGAPVYDLELDAPSPMPARRDELWKHSCFEAFFAPTAGLHYYEFNGSPSGDWALYRFDDYRTGMQPQPLTVAPELRHHARQATSLSITWHLPVFCSEPLARAGITAILRTRSDPASSTYWALLHAGPQPDFHLRASFIATVPPLPSAPQDRGTSK